MLFYNHLKKKKILKYINKVFFFRELNDNFLNRYDPTLTAWRLKRSNAMLNNKNYYFCSFREFMYERQCIKMLLLNKYSSINKYSVFKIKAFYVFDDIIFSSSIIFVYFPKFYFWQQFYISCFIFTCITK